MRTIASIFFMLVVPLLDGERVAGGSWMRGPRWGEPSLLNSITSQGLLPRHPTPSGGGPTRWGCLEGWRSNRGGSEQDVPFLFVLTEVETLPLARFINAKPNRHIDDLQQDKRYNHAKDHRYS